MKRAVIIASIVFFIAISVKSEFSGYFSGGAGYFSNPLYTYLMQSSKANSGYLELNYNNESTDNRLGLKYLGSASIFNDIQERSYYEHRFSLDYVKTIGRHSEPKNQIHKKKETEADDNSDSTETDDDEDEMQEKFNDSTFTYLGSNFYAGQRLDRTAFREFDNSCAGIILTYRTMISGSFYLRLTNDLGYRNYKNVAPLSNISDLFTITIGNKTSQTFNYGLNLTLGLKHFTQSFADTVFEDPVFIAKNFGSHTEADSTGIISISPQPDNLLQFTPSFFLSEKFGKTEIGGDIHYHKNLQSQTRFISESYISAFVNEDLYNDSFSYEGTGFTGRFKTILPWNVQASLNLDIQQKHYGYAAYDLTGNVIADKRFDLRTGIDLYVSKYFDLFRNFGMDVAILAGYNRNQSNDNFNNYYLYYGMVALGFGF